VNCVNCGHELMAASPVSMTTEFRGESITVEMQAESCPACGRDRIDGRGMDLFTRLVVDAYKSRHGLLTSAELRAARRRLGMSQRQFAEFVGIGVASLKRWERGEVQSEQLDRQVRLHSDPDYAEESLNELVSELVRRQGETSEFLEDVVQVAAEQARAYHRTSGMRVGGWFGGGGRSIAFASAA